MELLKFDHLKKTHPSGPILFSDVSAHITAPEIITLLGASGQGKSTLLRILGCLETPTHGRVSLHGKTVLEWSPLKWRKKVSYVAQHAVMLQGTVEENLKAVSRLHKTSFEHDLAKTLMKFSGLHDMNWNKQANELSGGEKQRVALVRSMLLRSEILLLDEVTASLDLQSKKLVEEMLKTWHQQEGTTLIWVTHDLEQAKYVSDRVWFMAEGTLLEDCAAESFFRVPSTQAGKKFINQPVVAGGV